jgi:PKD repeat protein
MLFATGSVLFGQCPTVSIFYNNAAVNNNTLSVCQGNSISLSANISSLPSGATASSYQWYTTNGPNFNNNNQISGQTSSSITLTNVQNSNDVNYWCVVTFTGLTGCTGNSSTSSLLDLNVYNPNLNAGSDQCLTGGNIDFGPTLTNLNGMSNSGTYSWTGPNGFTASVLDPSNITANAGNSGTYTLNYSYQGCTLTDQVNMVVIPGFSVDAGPASTLVCTGSSFSQIATVSNGPTNVTYQWTGPSGNNVGSAATLSLSNIGNNQLGTYTVTASASGCSVTDNITLVTVNPALSSNSYDAALGLFKKCLEGGASSGTIVFSENSADTYNNQISSYSINWGDGTTTIQGTPPVSWTAGSNQVTTVIDDWQSIAHSYTAGYYTLVYTLTTSSGCTITKEYQIFVGSVPANPTVTFPANISGCGPLTVPITLGGFSNNPVGTNYTLTFNDGSQAQTFTQSTIPTVINHTFSNSSCGYTSGGLPNVYGAQLIASNPCGSASGGASNLQVSIPPAANFTGSPSGCVGSTVLFNNTSNPGETVTGANCNQNYGYIWQVYNSAGVLVAPNSGIYSVASGSLGNNSIDPTDYSTWTNGTPQLGLIFSTPGTYSLRLIAKNGCATPSNFSQTICITSPLQPTFTAASPVCPGTSVAMNNTTAETNCGNNTWNWTVSPLTGWAFDPANNSTASSEDPNILFNTPGTYTVTLNASNSVCGAALPVSQTVIVLPVPSVALPADAQGCSSATNPYTVSFTPTTNASQISGTINYVWTISPSSGYTFLSGTNATSLNPVVQFNNQGPYNVTFTMQTVCGPAFDTQIITVVVPPTLTSITDIVSGCTNATSSGFVVNPTAQVNAGGATNLTYNWSVQPTSGWVFSNGTNANSTNPQLTFNTVGNYVMNLAVQNICGSAQLSDNFEIIGPPLVSIPAANGCAISGTPFIYNPGSGGLPPVSVSNNGANITLFDWTISPLSGTAIGSDNSATPNISISNPGSYSVALAATNSCGTTNANNTINVVGLPTVTMPTVNIGCSPYSVNMANLAPTVTEGGGTIQSYQWSVLQNGVVLNPGAAWAFTTGGQNSISPTLQFNTSGTYQIQLVVTNQCGSATAQTTAFAVQSPPSIVFPSIPTSNCAPVLFDAANVTIQNNGAAIQNLSWAISPNSGYTVLQGTLNSANPLIQFNAQGTYTVSLNVVTSCGSIPGQQIINVNGPPLLTLPSIPPSCSPLIYNGASTVVTSPTSPITSYLWSVTNVQGAVIPAGTGWSLTQGTLTSPQPNFSFTIAGTYVVHLLVTNSCGSTPAQTTVVVVTPPDVSFTTTDGCSPINISPVVIVNNGGGTGLAYQWTILQNGAAVLPGAAYTYLNSTNSTSAQPQFYFSQAGTYTIQLSAANQCGPPDIATNTVVIQSRPTVALSAPNNTQICAPVSYNPTATINNGGSAITSYQWLVTPNSGYTVTSGSMSGPQAAFQFTVAGTYTVSLTVSNACGQETTQQEITVNTPPSVALGTDASGCAPYVYAFSGANSPVVNTGGSTPNYLWSVSPNSGYTLTSGTLTSLSPGFNFTQAGNYVLTLSVSNACGSQSDGIAITVNQPPLVTIPALTSGCIVSGLYTTSIVPIVTTGSTAPVTNYAWTSIPSQNVTFSIAPNSLSPNTNVSITTGGTYALTLTATNDCGNTSATQNISAIVPPTVSLASVPPSCVPYTYAPLPLVNNGGGTISSYNWTITPGVQGVNWSITSGSLTSANPVINFLLPGSYTVIHNVINSCGNAGDTITILTSGTPQFTLSDPNATHCAPFSFTPAAFTVNSNNSSLTGTSWSVSPSTGWVLTSGSLSSVSPNPTFNFTQSGIYTIALTASNACGSTTDNIIQTINGSPAVTLASPVPTCTPYVYNPSPTISTNGSPVTSYTWVVTPAAGTPANGYSPSGALNALNTTFQFNQPGTYTVALTAQNACAPATTTSVNVVITGEPSISINPLTAVCAPSVVSPTALIANNGANITGYAWQITPATGWTATGLTTVSPQITFSAQGIYSISLTVTSNCGPKTSLPQTIQVSVAPTATIASTAGGCAPYTYDPAPVVTNGGGIITSYLWQVTPATGWSVASGALNSTYCSFYFTQPGQFNVSYTVVNGCGSTIVSQVVNVKGLPVVTLQDHAPACAPVVYPGTSGSPNIVTNSSPITSYQWAVSPGILGTDWQISSGTLTAANPSFQFLTAGDYTISLTATNGCGPHTDQTLFEVHSVPILDLPDAVVCNPPNTNYQPNPVILSSGGVNISSYQWSVFPNSGFSFTTASTILNPTINLSLPNTYQVTFSATNACGTGNTVANVISATLPAITIAEINDACAPFNLDPTVTVSEGAGTISSQTWSMLQTSGWNTPNALTDNNAIFNFSQPGNYTLQYAATNQCGTGTDQESFIVFASPLVDISNLPETICADEDFTPSLIVQSPGNPVTGYEWSILDMNNAPVSTGYALGNGVTLNSGNFNLTFLQAGDYQIKVEITNSCGQFSDIAPITIHDDPILNLGPDIAGCATLNLAFPGNSASIQNQGAPITSYAWSLPTSGVTITNGSISGSTIGLQFGTQGSYNIGLTVVNACGSDDDIQQVVVSSAIGLTLPSNVSQCAGSVVLPAATVLNGGAINSYQWSVNPSTGWVGTGLNSSTGTFNFTEHGQYTVTLALNTSCGPITENMQVSILEAPSVILTDINNLCFTGTSVALNPNALVDNGGIPATAYTWVVNPSATSLITAIGSLNSPQTTFNALAPGSYTLSLSGTNSCGTGTDAITANVISAPTLTLSNVVPTCAPFSYTPNYNLNNGGGVISSYAWVVRLEGTVIQPGVNYYYQTGNASSSNPLIVFTTAGSYEVQLTVQNACSPAAVSLASFVVNSAPVVNFAIADATICSGTIVNPVESLTGAGTGDVTWSVTPNTGFVYATGSSNLSTSTFNFSEAGSYSLSLTAANTCGSSTYSDNIIVSTPPVVSLPEPTALVHCSGVYTYGANATGNTGVVDDGGEPVTAYQWTITQTSGINPSFTYLSGNATSPSANVQFNSAGTYQVQLQATNACGPSSDAVNFVVISPPILTLANPTGTECAPRVYDPNPLILNGGGNLGNSLNWTVIGSATGYSANGGLNSANTTFTFNNFGQYTVQLSAMNECGSTTASQPISVQSPPNITLPNFTVNNSANCTPLLVTTGVNLVPNTSAPTSYSWSVVPNTGFTYSSGTSASMQPTFSFTQSGAYQISVTASNQCGTDIENQGVNVITIPTVSLANFPANTCIGVPFTPTLSQVSVLNGNGTISPSNGLQWQISPGVAGLNYNIIGEYSGAPTITFLTPGTFNIRLTATNQCGSHFDVETVSVAGPPLISGLSAINDCLDLGSGFTAAFTPTVGANGSTITGYTWNSAPSLQFENGTSSTSQNASFEVTQAGNYAITYTASNVCGTTTATTQIGANQLPVIANLPSTLSLCTEVSQGFSATVTTNGSSIVGQPSYTITPATGWQINSGALNSGAIDVTFLLPGTYTVVYSVSHNCTNNPVVSTTVVTVNGTPSFTLAAPPTNTCVATGGAFLYNPSPVFAANQLQVTNYAWTFNSTNVTLNGQANSQNATFSISNIGPNNTIGLTATNACGTSTINQVITTYGSPQYTLPAVPASNCAPVNYTGGATLNSPNGNGGSPISSTTWSVTPSAGVSVIGSLSSPSAGFTFNQPGTYSVNFNAQNAIGCPAFSQTQVITVYGAPEVSLATTNTGCAPFNYNPSPVYTTYGLPTTFNWSVTNASGTAVPSGLNTWDFLSGDVATSDPQFTFFTPGIYTLSLTMSNACASSVVYTTTVTVKGRPTVTLPALSAGCAPLAVPLGASSVNGNNSPVTSYLWSVSPTNNPVGYTFTGSPNASNTSVTFSIPNTYIVNLTVGNSCGVETASTTIVVNGAPTLQLSPIQQAAICANAGSPFVFTPTANVASNGATITSYSWTYTPTNSTSIGLTGASNLEAAPQYSFAQAGTYNVVLTVNSSCGNQFTTLPVVVMTSPSVSLSNVTGCEQFEYDPNSLGAAPNMVIGNGGGTISQYEWNIQGGAAGTDYLANGSLIDLNTNFSFVNSGQYTATLTATNQCGATTSLPNIIAVGQSPTLSIAPLTNLNCVPYTVQPQATVVDYGSPITSYTWSVSGGVSGTSLISNANTATPSVTLNAVGNYNLTLTVINSCGTQALSIPVMTSGIPSITMSTPPTGCVDQNYAPTPSIIPNNSPVTSTTYSIPNTSGWNYSSGNAADTTAEFVFTSYGSYPITLSAVNGCGTGTGLANVQVFGAPIIAAPVNTTPHCLPYTYTPGFTFNNAGSTIQSYAWVVTPSAGVVIQNPNSSNPNITFNQQGSYIVKCAAINSCDTTEQSQTINIITTPTITITPLAVNCVPFTSTPQVQIQDGGSAILPNGLNWSVTSGPSTGWSYAANSNSTMLTPSLVTTLPGIYNLHLTADNFCGTTEGDVTLTAQGVPSISVPDLQLCTSDPFDPAPLINANNNTITSYSWIVNPGAITSTDLNAIFTLGTAGDVDYNYALTAVNGCGSSTVDANVHVVAPPVVTLSADALTQCLEGFTLDENPVFNDGGGVISSYAWSLTGGSQVTNWNLVAGALNSNNADFSFATAGNYNLSVSIINECGTSTDAMNLTIQDLPDLNLSVVPPHCEPYVVQIPSYALDNNLSQVTNYAWTISPASTSVQFLNGTLDSSAYPTIEFGTDNTYTLQLAVTNICGVTTDSEQVVVYDTPIATVQGGIICPGGMLPINAIPSAGSGTGYTYLWTPSNAGLNYTIGQNVQASPIVTQPYAVQITDSNGCTSTSDLTVTVQPDPVLVVSDVNICAGNSAVLSASGATNYSWSPSTGLNQITGNPVTSTPATSITYTVTGTDPYPGCSGTAQLTVSVTDIVVNAGVDFEVCDQSPIIQLAGIPAGGIWTGNNVVNNQFIPNGPGVYNLTYAFTVNTAGIVGGCTFMDEMQITVNALPTATLTPDSTICPGIPIDITGLAAGGVGPYSVTWLQGGALLQTSNSTNPLTLNVAPLNSTTYDFEVVDANGCEAADNLMVSTWEQPIASASPDVTICSDQNTTLTGAGSLGLAPYQYDWFVQGNALSINSTTSLFVDTDNTTTYVFQIEDSHGCFSTDNTTVTVHPTPVANFQVVSSLLNVTCINTPISISNLSTGADLYEWYYDGQLVSTSQTPNIVPTGLGMHQISLAVENLFGCDDTIYLDVEVIAPPTSSFTTAYNPSGCGPLDVTFDNTSTGLYVTYAWEFSSNDLVPNTSNVAEPGVYTYQPGPDVITYVPTLTVENICGTQFYSQEIIVNPIPIPAFTLSQDVVCYPFPLDFNNTSLGLPDVYTWDMGDGSPIITIDATSPITNPQGYIYALVDDVTVYTITLTATNECGTVSTTQTVTVLPDVINAFVTANVVSGCSPLVVSFDGLGVGATQFSYDFGDGAVAGTEDAIHIFNATSYPSQIYDVEFSATNGCADDHVSIQIVVYPTPDGNVLMSDLGLCPNQNVLVDADVNDPYIQDYTWTINQVDVSGNVLGVANDMFMENLNNVSSFNYNSGVVPGLYQTQLDLTSINGCTNTITTNFEVYENPVAIATSSQGLNPIVCPGGEVWLQGNVQQSTGAQPYTYTWQDVSTGAISNLQFFAAAPFLPSDYIVTATDANGCMDSETITVDTYLAPVPIAGNDDVVCPGTTVQLTEFVFGGTQPYTNVWTDLDNNVVLNSTTVQPLIPNGTTYQLSTTDANGCVGVDEVVISLHEEPIAVIQPNFVLPLCSGSVAPLFGSEQSNMPVSQYAWSIGGVSNPVLGNLSQFDFVGTGSTETVYFTVTDLNGCSDSETITIQSGVTPIANIPNPNVNVCDGLVATLAVLPTPANSQVTWTGNGIVGAANQTIISVEPDLGGLCTSQTFQYDVAINNNGCVTNEVVLVTVYPTPQVTDNQETFCGNTNETLCVYSTCGTGILDYQWSIGNTVLSNSQCYPVNLSENTVFTISAIDEMGCTSSGTYGINILEVPELITSVSDNSICANDPVQLQGSVVPGTGQSPYTVQWINDATGAVVSASNAATVNPVLTNSYTYNVIDFNGCESNSSEGITVNPNPVFTLADEYLCSGEAGFLTAVPPVGTQYAYQWSPNNNTVGTIIGGALEILPQVNNGNVLTQLNYSVVVTDQFTGCLSTDDAAVFIWPQPIISITGPPATDILCYEEEAQLISNVTQGQWPWVISWEALNGLESGIGNTFTINPTETVVYEATVTDNQGCVGTDTYQVNVFDTNNLIVYAGPDVAVCSDGQATLQVNGVYANGVNPITMEWTYQGNPLIQSTTNSWDVPSDYNGILEFEVTDGNGCKFEDELSFVALNPQALISVGTTIGCSPLSVNLGANGGNTYSWTFCDGISSNQPVLTYDFVNPSTTDILNCTIELTAYLQQGSLVCESTAYETITINPTPAANFQFPAAILCDQEQVTITDLSSGAESYSWVLNGNPLTANQNIPEPNLGLTAPGNYIMVQTVSNSFGCQDSHTETINVLQGPDPVFSFNQDGPCVPVSVQFTDESQSPVAITGYEWNFGDGLSSFVQNPVHIYQNPGTYDVTLTVYSANGCSVEETVVGAFTFGELPDINNVFFTVTPEVDNEYNSTFNYNVDLPDLSLDYNWNFGDNYWGYGAYTQHYYEYVGTFNVELIATDNVGCQTSVNQVVRIEDPLNVYVPNAFTPDQNNLNEVFLPVIRGKDKIVNYTFQVVDRWGNTVFLTNDFYEGWNGTVNVRNLRNNFHYNSTNGAFELSNGSYLCQTDQYAWQIIIETQTEGAREFKGRVLLIR